MNAQGRRIIDDVQRLLRQDLKNISYFLQQIAAIVQTSTGADRSTIGLIVPKKSGRYIVPGESAPKTALQSGLQDLDIDYLFKVGAEELPVRKRSVMGLVAHTREPVRLGEVRANKYYFPADPNIRSELAVPIVLQDEALGVINLESNSRNHFTMEEQEILAEVARLIARPLDSLMTREGIRRPFLQVLEVIRDHLNDTPPGTIADMSDQLNGLAEIIGQALNSESCTIWLLDEKDDTLVLRGAHGRHKPFVNKHRSTAQGTVSRKAIAQRCILNYGANYVRDMQSVEFDEVVYGRKLNSPFMISPILGSGKGIGVIKVGLRKAEANGKYSNYSTFDEQLINMIQGQVGASLVVKDLEVLRREELFRRLRTFSESIHTDLNENTIFDTIVQDVPKLVNGRHCSIFMLEANSDKFYLRATTNSKKHEIGKVYYKPGEGLTGWVARHGKSLVIDQCTPLNLRKIHPELYWMSKYNEGDLQNEQPNRPWIAVPVFQDGEVIGVLRVSDRMSGTFNEVDENILSLVAFQIAAALSYARQYGKRIQLLHELRELMLLTHSLDKLSDDIDSFESTIVEDALQRAGKILNTDVVSLYKYDDELGSFITPPILKGNIYNAKYMGSAIHDDDVPYKVLRLGSQYWPDCQDANLLTGTIPPRDGLPKRQRFVAREQIVSSAGIQLRLGGTIVGVLFLNFRTPQNFEEEQKEIIDVFASQIAISLELARLSRKIKAAAHKEEDEYLAMELHDALQILSVDVVNRAGFAIEQIAGKDNEGALRDLRVIERAAQFFIQECRFVMKLLEQHAVEEVGIQKLLSKYFTDTVRNELKVHTQFENVEFIPPAYQRHLYRIIQSAFANVVLHSMANEVNISLRKSDSLITLDIEDDGIGFDYSTATSAEGHYGLRGIKNRVKLIHGDLSYQTTPGKGTKIGILIPVTEDG